VTLGAGGLAVTQAATGSGAPSGFVPITPCRLFDTRADNQVGPRGTPLTAGESYVQQVTATNGNCTVPAGASAIALNVTTVSGTALSYLTLWPTDAGRPLASSLNWAPGASATPNKVDVRLSADGKVSLYNDAGTVNVLADVVGYYVSLTPTGTSRLLLDPAAFSTDGEDPGWLHHNFAEGRLEGGPGATCGVTAVSFPQGATIIGVTAHVSDSTSGAGFDVAVKLWRNPIGVSPAEVMFQATTVDFPGDITLTGTTITEPVIDNTQFSYFASVCGLRELNFLYDMGIDYTNP
jgi:hypothetical protein